MGAVWGRALGCMVALVVCSASASAEERRVWGGSQMVDVPPDVDRPRAWTVTGTIADFEYDRRLKGWMPIDLLTWPAAPRLDDRAFEVGSRVTLMAMRCFVDDRWGRRTVRCEDGRAPVPALWIASFASIGPDPIAALEACFDVEVVAPTKAELARARASLTKKRTAEARSFGAPERLVRIEVHRRWFERRRVVVDNQKMVDVEERFETIVDDATPRVTPELTGLSRVVPITAAREPEPAFEDLVMRRVWFPGRFAYAARRLARVDPTGLPPTLRTVLAYDLVVEALAISDTETARVALARLDASLVDEPSARVREMIGRAIVSARALSLGERLLYHPCTGQEHR